MTGRKGEGVLGGERDRVKRKGRGERGVEAENRMRLLEDLRKMVEEHPGELWRRATAVRHDLDDGLLLRWVGGWVCLLMGVAATVAWDRPSISP